MTKRDQPGAIIQKLTISSHTTEGSFRVLTSVALNTSMLSVV